MGIGSIDLAIDAAVDPGERGCPLLPLLAAKAVTLRIAYDAQPAPLG
jgi:glycine/serine hydroxymethyltransferase